MNFRRYVTRCPLSTCTSGALFGVGLGALLLSRAVIPVVVLGWG